MDMVPAPFQTIVPALSSVREVIEINEALLIASVTPGGMMVRPVPVIAPPIQLIAFPIVTFCAPPNVPFAFKVRNAGATIPVPSKLAVTPEMIIVLLVQM